MTKLYAQGKQVFDINKVTIVGSPTITSDGVLVATNTDYLKSTFTLDKLNGKSWRFICKTYWSGRNNGTYYTINLGDVYCYFRITSTQELVFNGYLASDNSQVYQAKYAPSIFDVAGWYWVEMSFDYETGTYRGYAGKNKNEMTQLLEIVKGEGEQLRYLDSSHFILFRANNTIDTYSLDLLSFDFYADNKLVYSPTKPVYALERRKPKVWNKGQFTIVGNPSISESGVASGFSASNYVTKENVVISNNNWEFILRFTTNDTSKNQGILSFSSGYTVGAIINPDGNSFYVSFGQGSSFNIGEFGFTVSKNKTYTIKIGYDGQKYFISELVNNEFVLRASKVSTLLIPTNLGTLRLGLHRSGGSFLNGSIDLKQFKIYTDNNLVFDGGADTYVYDPSKFTVVGSPTITSDGVASGFSSSNYVQVGKNLSDNWGFILPIKITNDTTSLQGIARFYSLSDEVVCQIRKEGARVYIAGFGGAVGNFAFNPNYTLNQTIYLKVVKNGNSLTLSYSSNLIDWNDSNYELTGYTVPDVSRIVLGVANPSWVGLQGSIDLTQFEITVDGKEVFTGAKEKFYAMRGM